MRLFLCNRKRPECEKYGTCGGCRITTDPACAVAEMELDRGRIYLNVILDEIEDDSEIY